MESSFTIESHFQGKEALVWSSYYRLLASLRKFGPVTESPKKGSIHLDDQTGFAGVCTRKTYILLHFRVDYPIDNQRIQKQVQLSARRFKQTVKLVNPSQVDQELMSWLRDAYQIAG